MPERVSPAPQAAGWLRMRQQIRERTVRIKAARLGPTEASMDASATGT
jgi:hypothetical protein